MGRNRNLRWEDMDKSKMELSVLMQHIEVHNKTKPLRVDAHLGA